MATPTVPADLSLFDVNPRTRDVVHTTTGMVCARITGKRRLAALLAHLCTLSGFTTWQEWAKAAHAWVLENPRK